MDTKMFVYIGQGSPVFKPGVNALFSRGVPKEVSALFQDLFEKDPLFIEVSKSDAKTMEGEDPTKVVKGLKKAHDEKLAQWKKERDAYRAKTPQPVRTTTVSPTPPKKAKKPKK